MRVHVYSTTDRTMKATYDPPGGEVLKHRLSKKIIHVAKPRSFEDDMYYEYLRPSVYASYFEGNKRKQVAWLIQTFRHEYGVQDGAIDVYVLKGIPMGRDDPKVQHVWHSGSDHAKWAISHSKEKLYLVHVGDMNRQVSQFFRGGGGFVLQSETLWKFLYSMIETDPRVIMKAAQELEQEQ